MTMPTLLDKRGRDTSIVVPRSILESILVPIGKFDADGRAASASTGHSDSDSGCADTEMEIGAGGVAVTLRTLLVEVLSDDGEDDEGNAGQRRGTRREHPWATSVCMDRLHARWPTLILKHRRCVKDHQAYKRHNAVVSCRKST
jgi:hypothetical protein